MRTLCFLIIAFSGFVFSSITQAASIYAGKSKAAAVCSQCHGVRASSSESPFPPLAGRDEEYIKKALKEYRDKTRVSEIMNNIAASLSDRDINNIANYYSRLKAE
jgi:cytochrome c553